MAAQAQIDINISAAYTKSVNIGSYSGTSKLSDSITLSTSDISKIYTSTVTSASPTTLDLTSLTDAYGAGISFSTVKLVAIENTGTATLTVGTGTNAVYGNDQYTLKAGYLLPITSQFSVDGTHKILRLTPAASTTFNIIVAGS